MKHPVSSEDRVVFAETTRPGELQYTIAQNYIQPRGHNQVKIQTDTDTQIAEDQLHLQDSCPVGSCEE